MNGLFIELYLDEDVSALVAKLLVARGFDAITTLEAGQTRNSDDDQLAFATNQKKTLLTHNRVHFEAISQEYFAAGKVHHGIIIAVRRPAHEIVRRLLAVLNHVTADEMQNQIRYI